MFTDAFMPPPRARLAFTRDQIGSRLTRDQFKAAWKRANARATGDSERARLRTIARAFDRYGVAAYLSEADFEFLRELAGPAP